MRLGYMKIRCLIHDFIARCDGQDMIEYGLVVALLSFAAVTGVRSLASQITIVYSSVASTFTSNVT